MTPFNFSDIQLNTHRNKLIEVCLTKRTPFVSFHLPNSSEITTYVQYSTLPRKLNTIENLTNESGFVMAPFYASNAFPVMLLEPDYVHIGNNSTSETIEKLNYYIPQNELNTTIYQTSPFKFSEQIEMIKKKMKEGAVNKVVLSRIKVENEGENVNLITLFNALCESYPQAFVYIIQLPEAGIWLGASPEPILLINNNTATTTSIAGTQVLGNKAIAEIKWMNKELNEQAIVTEYIERVLKSYDVTNLHKEGPYNYQAANLVHLKTQFEFDATSILPILGEFIDALQPTPSVCGLPKNSAKEILIEIEKHNREYYSGLIGPVNMNNQSSLFVNLRCMKVVNEGFALFVGAGITKCSNTAREWDETSHKMMTLLSVINRVKSSTNANEFSKTGSKQSA